MPTDKPRLTITLSEDKIQEIEKFRHQNGLRSLSAAISELMKIGVDQLAIADREFGACVVRDARTTLMVEMYEKLDDNDKALLYDIGQCMLKQNKY